MQAHWLKPLSPSLDDISLISTLLTFAGPGPMPRCCLNLSSELWSPWASPVTVPSLLFLTKPVMLSLLAWSVVHELLRLSAEVVETEGPERGMDDLPEVHALDDAFNLEGDLGCFEPCILGMESWVATHSF